jgi:diaminopimelate decarboxylase
MISNSLESAAFSAPFTLLPTPFHLYSESRALEDAKDLAAGLRHFLPNLELYYSTKTNALIPLLKAFLSQGWGLEVVCPGDRRAAASAGAVGKQLLLNGPAWPQVELEEALFAQEVAQITLDSLSAAEQLGRALKCNSRTRTPLRVALRIHEGHSHFGLPASLEIIRQAIACVPKSQVATWGLHTHTNPAGSVTQPEEIADDFRTRADLLGRLGEQLPEITFLDLGGGIDSPFVYRPLPSELGDFHNPGTCASLRQRHEGPRFSLKDAGHKVSAAVRASLGANLARWQIQMEPGRAVCTRALSTVIEVQAVKEGLYPDATVVITDGNTAILGPLHRGVHPLTAERTGLVETFVYGNLPHSADWLFQAVDLPALKVGDRLVVSHTGAYFLALEANFGHGRPGIYRENSGKMARAPESALEPSLRDSAQ